MDPRSRARWDAKAALVIAFLVAGCGRSVLGLAGADDAGTTSVTRRAMTFTLIHSALADGYALPFFLSDDGSVVAGLMGAPLLHGLQVFRWTRDGQVRVIEPPDISRSPNSPGILGLGMSRDASTLMGTAAGDHSQGTLVFRWSEGDGARTLTNAAAGGEPLDISADGSVIVAQVNLQASRWTAATGFVPLGILPGDMRSEAVAVSDDGRVVVGHSFASATSVGSPFRWTREIGLAPLGIPAAMTSCELTGQMSRDGRVAFGVCLAGKSSITGEMVRWAEDGAIEEIPVPAPWPNGRPRAATADGAVLLGELELGPPPLPGHTAAIPTLFRWTEAGGVVPLGADEAGASSFWEGSSRDGGFVVGDASLRSPNRRRAIRWTADGRALRLEPPAGFDLSEARSVSDGGVVAGLGGKDGQTSAPDHPWAATLWDEGGQAHLVSDLLSVAGADLQGARLVSAIISRDGKTLMGGAYDAQDRLAAWVATLP